MPYIKLQDRAKFIDTLDALNDTINTLGISSGEFNYLLTKVALMYLSRHGATYSVMADVVAAFECAKLEFSRRVIAPYEDRKIALNGDVYTIA